MEDNPSYGVSRNTTDISCSVGANSFAGSKTSDYDYARTDML